MAYSQNWISNTSPDPTRYPLKVRGLLLFVFREFSQIQAFSLHSKNYFSELFWKSFFSKICNL